jgi:hypothetical protein
LEFFFDGSPDEIRDQEEALATQLASRWHGQEHFVDLCAKLIKLVQNVLYSSKQAVGKVLTDLYHLKSF